MVNYKILEGTVTPPIKEVLRFFWFVSYCVLSFSVATLRQTVPITSNTCTAKKRIISIGITCDFTFLARDVQLKGGHHLRKERERKKIFYEKILEVRESKRKNRILRISYE